MALFHSQTRRHVIKKLRVIETAAKLIQNDIKAVETRKDIYFSSDIDISTTENV